ESIFLGIPVPSMFMATNKDSSWEVIDGLQRLTTLINFIGDKEELKNARTSYHELKLTGLEKLEAMNSIRFKELPSSIRMMFLTRPLRITVLNDRSDFSVRYDLFERLNTGGVTLHEQEIRNCVYIGEFNNFIKELAENKDFRSVVKMTSNAERNGSYEELVLKFFAYYENSDDFVHSVKGFLNDYMAAKTKKFRNKNELNEIFKNTFKILNDNLPEGIVRGNRKNITPVVLYEAISVGTALALDISEQLKVTQLAELLNDSELKKVTTGATNSKSMLKKRMDIVKGSLI
ncbi:MAG: DUF262 domain-containing protein, partial [Carnobacterium maltaromaticum]